MVALRHSRIPTSHSAPSHSLTPRALSFSKGDTSQVVFPLVTPLQTEQRYSLSMPLASWGQPQDAKTGEKRPLHQPLLSHWDLTPTSSSRLPAAQILGHPMSNCSVSIEVEPSYKTVSISGLQQQSDLIIYIYIFFFFKIIFHYRLLQDKVCLNLFLKTLS